MSKRTVLTVVAATALAVGGSVAFASPAFADPTPATGPVTTISNLVVGIDNSAGRQVHVQYSYSIADPSLAADSIVEVTTHDSCDTPTVVDRDVPLSSPGGGISLFVTVPSDGYVEVKVYSSNGTSAPLVSAPVDATDITVTPVDTTGSFNPGTPPTTGTFGILVGGRVPNSSFQLYVDGTASGPVITVPGCGESVQNYSGAPGTVLSLHNIEGNFDVATTTIPGARTAPADPADPTTPTLNRLPMTGVGPDAWYAGGFGLAAVIIGGLLLVVRRRVASRG
jgi:hypothetical protein